MAEEHPFINKILADDYRILSFLGKGGMGTVFVAEQISLGRQVAIKLLPSLDLSSEECCRFESEIAAMATLCHPNIVAVHHRGKFGDPPTLYYVMEYLEGGSLKNYLQEYGKLPTNLSLRLVHHLADALAYAHEQGWIHRDIKPDNLLFNSNYRSLKIADFGIAKLEKGYNITKSQSMVGTFLYAPPEQMKWFEQAPKENEPDIDHRADQYSLGIVLYEMMTGRLPYQARNFMEMMKALSSPPLTLSAVTGKPFHPSIEWLTATMIEKDRDKRFLTDEQLLEAISNVETEILSSTSKRVFAVKTEEMLHVPAPKPTDFPSQSERIFIQNLKTMDSSEREKSGRWGREKVRQVALGLLVLVVVLLSLYSIFKEAPKEVGPDSKNPKPVETRMVGVEIIPRYDLLPPPSYTRMQVLFIAEEASFSYEKEKKFAPGSYHLSVVLPGYFCEEHGKAILLTDVEKNIVELHFAALPRKVEPIIMHESLGRSVTPLLFKMGVHTIASPISLKPGKYSLFARFRDYEDLDTTIEIPPGEGSFVYRHNLVPLKEIAFSLGLPLLKGGKSLQIYGDGKEIPVAHFQYQVKKETCHVALRVPQETKKILLRWGIYYSQTPLEQIYLLNSFENMDAALLLASWREEKEKALGEKDLSLLCQEKEKLQALPVGGKKALYEFLQQATKPIHYQNMDSSLWILRSLLSTEEQKERDAYQKLCQTAQSMAWEERMILWESYLKKFPASAYRTAVQGLLDYDRQMQTYKTLLQEYLQECYLSPSEKRNLKKIENHLKQEDIQNIRQQIEIYLKELKCNKSLEEMLKER